MSSGVSVVGLDEVQAAIRQLSARCEDMTPVMGAIGEILESSTEENFAKEGRPSWHPLAPATKDGRRKPRLKVKILQDTGRLKRSVTVKVGKKSVEIGTNLRYAAIHQFGGQAGRGHKVHIPARPFIHPQPEDWQEILDTIADFVAEPLTK